MDNLGPELMQYWDFDPNSFQLLAARENTIYCAQTERGNIVIRKHRTGYQDAAGIESELCLMHAMKAANCSVPDAIAATANRFVSAHDGDHFTAISWVSGQTMSDVLSANPVPTGSHKSIMTLAFVWPNSMMQRMPGPRQKLFTTFLGPFGPGWAATVLGKVLGQS